MRIERNAEPIPGYKLVERLGGGGFGEVWKAEAPGGLLKAIKLVYGDASAIGDDSVRTEQEYRALNRVKSVRHPYILSLERYEIIDGRLVIVMELADKNIWDRFKECRASGEPGIPRDELLRYMDETAEALDLMNIEYQLQHLDIKPQNLFLVHNHVKVADFGLVKDLHGKVTTITGGVTPVYAAPETFDGWLTRYTDQYSLAIVYQELLTGKRPFAGNNVHQLILQHVEGQPDVNPLPDEDREPIRRALSKNPEERHPSCTALMQCLRRQPTGTALASPIAPGREAGHAANGQCASDPDAKDDQVTLCTAPRVHRTNGRVVDVHSQPVATVGREAENTIFKEQKGEGELFPALVVGIGRTGWLTLRSLRQAIENRFGDARALSNVRLVYIDTNLESSHRLSGSATEGLLDGIEIVHARLNRPSHFLRSRGSSLKLNVWFPQNMLYRIPRTLETNGIRCLGRLAFFDNFRSIAQHFRDELEACVSSTILDSAAQQTGLKICSNRPRAYVVASLSGGTGSGMFIDAAYLIRKLLGEMRVDEREVIGLLTYPSEPSGGRKLELANAYAALMELSYFSRPEITFAVRYEDRGDLIQDQSPPFERCVLVPESKKNHDRYGPSALAQYLFRHVSTPLRILLDKQPRRRSEDECGSNFQTATFGIAALAWPRRQILSHAARQICVQLIDRWMTKADREVVEKAQGTVQERLQSWEIDAQSVIPRLQAACERQVGAQMETAFTQIIESALPKETRKVKLECEDAIAITDKLQQLVGEPTESAVLQRPGVVEPVLQQEADQILQRWQSLMRELLQEAIENPSLRLGGAEEIVRQMGNRIESGLKAHESLLAELVQKTNRSHERLLELLGELKKIGRQTKRNAPLLAELVELFQQYPRCRFQSLVLRRLSGLFTSFRGYLSDQLRELNSYRLRLAELSRKIAGIGVSDHSPGGDHETWLYPPGCNNLEDAVRQLHPASNAEQLVPFDHQVQELIKQRFGSLDRICTATTNLLKEVEDLLVADVLGTLEQKHQTMPLSDVLAKEFSDDHIVATLRQLAERASPGLSGQSAGPEETLLVATGASQKQEQFAALISHALPDATLGPSGNDEEIVIYRERPFISLDDLEQLPKETREAYFQLANADFSTPHNRIDIPNWSSVNPS